MNSTRFYLRLSVLLTVRCCVRMAASHGTTALDRKLALPLEPSRVEERSVRLPLRLRLRLRVGSVVGRPVHLVRQLVAGRRAPADFAVVEIHCEKKGR